MKKLLVLSLLLSGCGKKPGSYEISDAASESATDQQRDQAEALWLQRGDKDSLSEALGVYEQLFVANPTDREIAARLVRGWYFYGDAHETEKEGKEAAWDKAIAFGSKCLNINEAYANELSKEGKREDAAQYLVKEDVPCVYWTASALGKWGKSIGLATTLKHLGAVEAWMNKVEELDASFFYGGVHRYWGALYAGKPSFAGRDMDRSISEFNKSLEIAPEYLGTRILIADYWAKTMQDHELFDENVQYVLASDPSILDESILPENESELRKAKKLMEQRSDLFVDAPAEPAPLVEQPPVKEEPVEVAPTEEAPTEEAPTEGSEEETNTEEGSSEENPK
jgi:tetratricopeptide (TPR) repeat protein